MCFVEELDLVSITQKYSYQLGGIARSDEIRNSDSQKVHFGYAAVLRKGDGVFVLRSDKTWRFAIVLERVRGKESYINFLVNYEGSVKKITAKHWSSFVRGIRRPEKIETEDFGGEKSIHLHEEYIGESEINTCDPNSSCSHQHADSVDHVGLYNTQEDLNTRDRCLLTEPSIHHRNYVKSKRFHTMIAKPSVHVQSADYSSSPEEEKIKYKPGTDNQIHSRAYMKTQSERIVSNNDEISDRKTFRRTKSEKTSQFGEVDNVKTLFELVMVGKRDKMGRRRAGIMARAA